MDDFGVARSLDGANTVVEWFGKWPSFHDAEIISISLARGGESILRVHPCFPDKPATVEFVLDEIADLELAGFTAQNVIFDLAVERLSDMEHGEIYRLTLSPCYGLAGRIDARRLRVRIVPGKSFDGLSQ